LAAASICTLCRVLAIFAGNPNNDLDARNLFLEATGRNSFAASDQRIHPTYNIGKIDADLFMALLIRAKSAEC
jgi:hypothetical protein